MDPILTIAIPIYNRGKYLRRMYESFLCDKELFEEKVYLHVSDNCSEEDLKSLTEEYQRKGLTIHYHRNDTNIGGDNNIISCYQVPIGKYLLVLGSDDVPSPGYIGVIEKYLETNTLGVLHLNHHNIKKKGLQKYNDRERFTEDVNIWFTFISSNVVLRKSVEGFDFEKYRYTNFSQVALFLKSISENNENAIYSYKFLDGDDESKNNGGYNVFKIFVENLLAIFHEGVEQGWMTENCFEEVKKRNFKDLIAGDVARRLILRKKTKIDTEGGWAIIKKYYGACPYAYWYVVKELCKTFLRKLHVIK